MLLVLDVAVCLIVGFCVVSLVVVAVIVSWWTAGEEYIYVAVSLAMC